MKRTIQFQVLRLLLFVGSMGISGFVKSVYRPWAYQHEVPDLGFAGWAPSFFYILGLGMLLATLIQIVPGLRRLKFQTMIGAGLGALGYEISQAIRSDRTFSWPDVLATIGGIVAALLIEKVVTMLEAKSLKQG
ncbi:MAG TPA: hypothetical protein G4O08_01040 [Anaerolineae bacterium]|nr:hypothetical protein [Anaerolineae bacterium]